MSMTLGNQGRTSAEINVTPMIDVLLVLLIIFMVLFPHQSVGQRAEIPQQSTTTLPEPGNPIVIQIKQALANQRPSLQINAQEVSWQDLDSRLRQIYATRTNKIAFLKGDPEIDFQTVTDVIDIVHHAGVEQIGLLGTPQK